MVNSSIAANRHYKVVDLTGSSPVRNKVLRWDADTDDGLMQSKFQPYTGAKKLEIKNLKQTQRTTPEELLKRTWTQLGEALTAIFRGDRVSLPLEELYRGVEAVSRLQAAPALFGLLEDRCKEYVRTTVKAQLLQLAGTGVGNVDVLRAVQDAWTRWSSQVVSGVVSDARSAWM